MSHANAALTPRARLRLAKLIVDEHWPVATAAKMFMVSPPTARKWATRFRAEGPAGMVDRLQWKPWLPAPAELGVRPNQDSDRRSGDGGRD